MTTELKPPPMSDEQILQAILSIGEDAAGRIALTYESGPYDIDKPTHVAARLSHALNAARDAQWLALVGELQRDAERYRWLRDKGRYNNFSVEQEKPGWVTTHTASTLDAAIDAALSSEGKGAEG